MSTSTPPARRTDRTSEIAYILHLMVNQPNRRDAPLPNDIPGGFDFWFDGGAAVSHTGGGTVYRFVNGAQARQPYGWEPGYPNVYVSLADGTEISIKYV